MTAALDRMSTEELAVILLAMLKKHSDLKHEAEEIAIQMMSSPSMEEVSEEVFSCVSEMGLEELHGRAGNHPWGYVEPSEAAWKLLEEAIQNFNVDMKRRMELGLDDAAFAICCGIVVGLNRAVGVGHGGLLDWAPDFPVEGACCAVVELIESCPVEKRADFRTRLVQALGDSVPQWRDFISRAAERALHGRDNESGKG